MLCGMDAIHNLGFLWYCCRRLNVCFSILRYSNCGLIIDIFIYSPSSSSSPDSATSCPVVSQPYFSECSDLKTLIQMQLMETQLGVWPLSRPGPTAIQLSLLADPTALNKWIRHKERLEKSGDILHNRTTWYTRQKEKLPRRPFFICTGWRHPVSIGDRN